MAGLFGFYTRAPRAPEWMAVRLRLLQRAMVTRPHHSAHVEVHAHAAFGNSGPGLHAGTLAAYVRPDGSIFMAEGEMYRVGSWSSAQREFDDAWPLVHERWAEGDAQALVDLDGLYTSVRYEPRSPDGPRLSLASDRYASRRLFVLEDGDEFAFAADFAALAAWLGPRLEIDPDFITDSICLGAPLGDRTWARQIRLYPPATEFRVTAAGLRRTRYWDFSRLASPAPDTTVDAVERVDAAWQDAMAARMRGTRLGQQLSGGLDSRLILADGQRRRNWLTITYGERGSDEVRFARACADAVNAEWLLWELPGERWLERRVALSLENGGFVDLMNGHHAGLVEHLRGRLDFEISGFVGDFVLGDTYTGLSPQEAFWKLPYWHSPVSLDEQQMQDRVLADIGGQDTWGWMMDTKVRRLTNYWPHLAVNDLEVRKPFVDYRLVECCAALPLALRRDRVFHRQLLERRAPALLRIPVQKTAAPPGASSLRRMAARAVRRAYRGVQPTAAGFGLPVQPWIRGAYVVTRWLQAPDVKQALQDGLLGPSARITSYVDRAAIVETLRRGVEGGGIADEVPLNLYRIEQVLQHLPEWCAAGPRS